MSLRNLIRSTTVVEPDFQRPQQLTEEVLRRRITVARANPKWTELEDIDLVRRGPFKVSASTDEVFTLYRGSVFEGGSANVFEQTAALHFVVTDDNGLVF